MLNANVEPQSQKALNLFYDSQYYLIGLFFSIKPLEEDCGVSIATQHLVCCLSVSGTARPDAAVAAPLCTPGKYLCLEFNCSIEIKGNIPLPSAEILLAPLQNCP